VIQNDARRQLHVRAEQVMMPAGRLLLQSIASPGMIEAELAQRAPSMQRPIAACGEADLRPELEAASPKGSDNRAASGQHDREFHRVADEAHNPGA
jgi:hypothetical protein